VNGNRVNMSFLSSGDSLRFGPVQCRFQLPERGFARLGVGSSEPARAPTSAAPGIGAARNSGARGSRLVLIAAISFVVTVLIIGFVWWHSR
jgi:hypothetical protein